MATEQPMDYVMLGLLVLLGIPLMALLSPFYLLGRFTTWMWPGVWDRLDGRL